MPRKTQAEKNSEGLVNDEDEISNPRRGKKSGASAAPYDFRRPRRVSKERLRTLEGMHERLVKSLEGWLVGRVRGQIELSLRGVEQLSFADFTLGLSTPCCSYLVDIRDSGGQLGVVDFNPEFAYFLVDKLLGGRGSGDQPQRTLTPIERMIVRTVAERITHGVREIWEESIPLDLAVSGFETVPEILRSSNGDTPVLVSTIEVRAAGREGLVSIVLPFAVLDTFFADANVHRRATTGTGSEAERQVNLKVTEGSLRVTTLPVAARLPEFRISMKQLTSLQAGSMLGTGLSRNTEIELLVGGVPRFRGRPARVGRRLAVNLTEPLAEIAAPAEPGTGLKLFEEEI